MGRQCWHRRDANRDGRPRSQAQAPRRPTAPTQRAAWASGGSGTPVGVAAAKLEHLMPAQSSMDVQTSVAGLAAL